MSVVLVFSSGNGSLALIFMGPPPAGMFAQPFLATYFDLVVFAPCGPQQEAFHKSLFPSV